MNSKPLPTLKEFRATGRKAIENELPCRDGFAPTRGLAYWKDILFIQHLGWHAWHVELFGDDFTGGLRECEQALYDAAMDEGIFD